MSTYNLDLIHYFTSSSYFAVPGLSWDAILKSTNISLELLTDIETIAFIKKGILDILLIHVTYPVHLTLPTAPRASILQRLRE